MSLRPLGGEGDSPSGESDEGVESQKTVSVTTRDNICGAELVHQSIKHDRWKKQEIKYYFIDNKNPSVGSQPGTSGGFFVS